MNHPFISYKVFDNEGQFREYCEILSDHGITFETESFKKSDTDPFTAGLTGNTQYILKIAKGDFPRANEVLETLRPVSLPGHYLLEFTNEELLDVISGDGEWSNNDQWIAKDLLHQRNVSFNEEALKLKRKEEENNRLIPKQGYPLFLIFGFIVPYLSLAVWVFRVSYLSIFGSIFTGFALGMNYRYNYHRDLLSQKYFYYNRITRKIGLLLMINALVAGTIVLAYLVFRYMGSYF